MGRHLFIGSGDGKLYCLDNLTGEKIWSFSAKLPIYTTPAVAGGLVIFGSNDDHIYALDRGTGELKWSYRTGFDGLSSTWSDSIAFYAGSHRGSVKRLAQLSQRAANAQRIATREHRYPKLSLYLR